MIKVSETFARIASRIFCVILMTAFLYGILAYRSGRSSKENELVVYSYSDMLSSSVFEEFERETGIRVLVRHFETIEEILTKLAFEREGDIDVIAPTDAMIETLINEDLLAPVDKRALGSYGSIDKRFLGRFYDPRNEFSVPFAWSPVGILYDDRAISYAPRVIGWDLIFGRIIENFVQSPHQIYGEDVGRVCLGEDPMEVYFLAALHLFGSFDSVAPEHDEKIVALLRAQKRWLECYTNNMKYFLIAGVTHAAVAPAAYYVQMHQEHEWIRFVVPSEGSLMLIGNLAIPASSKKKALAHKVVEYLLSVRGSLHCFRKHAYNPVNKDAYSYLPSQVREHNYVFPEGVLFERLETFHNKVPLQRIEAVWNQTRL
jgi:spermidine/putrescine transport system substrate-binding protein